MPTPNPRRVGNVARRNWWRRTERIASGNATSPTTTSSTSSRCSREKNSAPLKIKTQCSAGSIYAFLTYLLNLVEPVEIPGNVG